MKYFALLFLLLPLWPTSLRAAEQEWSFVRVSSSIDKYNVVQGTAKVTVYKGRFSALLTDTSGGEYRLAGTISKGKVVAKFTVVDSDYFIDSPMMGSLTRKHWSKPASSGESITLTDGWNFVGLTREIRNP
jgi:hypothetical protein